MSDTINSQAFNRRLDFNHFVSSDFDAETIAEISVGKLIVICTVPRTAGNTLCRHMTANNWGVPTEYYLPDIALPLLNRWSAKPAHSMQDIMSRATEYTGHLVNKRTVGGIFSVKLFPHQWQQFIGTLSLRAGTKNIHCILLQREDLIEQTISSLATQLTQRPSFSTMALGGLTKVDHVDLDLVRRTFEWLLEKESQWPRLIASYGGVLHRVSSEELIGNPFATLSVLADKLELSLNLAATQHSIALEYNGAYQTNQKIKDELRLQFLPFLRELMSHAQRP